MFYENINQSINTYFITFENFICIEKKKKENYSTFFWNNVSMLKMLGKDKFFSLKKEDYLQLLAVIKKKRNRWSDTVISLIL